MKRRKIDGLFILKSFFIALAIFSCGWFVIAQAVLPSEQNMADYYFESFDDGWVRVYTDGREEPFAVPGDCDIEPGETAVLKKMIPQDLETSKWLCFRTSKQDMGIYIGDEQKAFFSTKNTRPFGLASASIYMFVEVRPEDAGKPLIVRMSSDSVYSGVMRTVMYGDKGGILNKIIAENIPTLFIAVHMLILGLGGVVTSYMIQYQMKTKVALRHLGWCMVNTSIWIITQSKIKQVLFPNVSATSIFSQFALYLIPLPLILYMNEIQKNRYRKGYVLIGFLTIINFVCNTALMMLNIKDQADLYVTTYSIIGILIVLISITLILDFKNRHIKEYRVVAYGVVGFLIASVMQLLQALNMIQISSANLLCVGMIILLIMAAVQTVTDIIRREEKKKEELFASEAKSRFLAGMSHEIRTPINAVLGINEMIARDTKDEIIREYTRDIQSAGRNLLSIVNDILDFSKIDSGKMEIILSEYELSSVINDSVGTIKVRAEKKKLAFRIRCNENLPSTLLGDEVRIRQILINLLSNAVKYTKAGMVVLDVDGEKDEQGQFSLIFTVKDTGIGIREENFPKLFDSFKRIEDEAHKIEGTGLGLSIVHELVTLMSGKIYVDSTYGKGSEFKVVLPQEIISEKPIGDLSDIHSRSNEMTLTDFEAPDARILVVDDVQVNLKVFCGLLRDTGIVIDTADNGMECLQKIRTNAYDMIFMDHMMPDLDGVETLQEIHKMSNEAVKDIPIIMLTANAVLGAKEDYLKKGFRDYLSKPIQKGKLLSMVKEYLPKELLRDRERTKAASSHKGMVDVPFLDTEEGLAYYSGDWDFYLEIIKMIQDADHREELQELYKNNQWDRYHIIVHSLASTLQSVGAKELAEGMRGLENAAKLGDINYLRIHHTATMMRYRELLENIKNLSIQTTAIPKVSRVDKNWNILLVDDDKISLKAAKRILDPYFRVTCMGDGEKALAHLERSLPDLILMDIYMPKMNGFEVLAKIKENERTKEIPVVFLTGDNDIETELNGYKMGAADYIHKPFVPDIMLERINKLLESEKYQQHLQNEVEKKTNEVAKISLQAMLTLAQTIDAKDKYTKGHSTRVAEYSRKLARQMGLSAEEQENVYYMGLLHDIGKIGVPDYIINKTQVLTDEEFAIIREHPKMGYDILKTITELPHIAMGARWHHERMDGSGYPDGLKGDEIPLLVKIISVADAYDAMNSKRSYRDVLPQNYVRSEIERGKGNQFDPYVADAMLELINKG